MLLADWLEQANMTNKAFAATLGVTEESARLYRAGLRRPSNGKVKAIIDLTDGMVTEADITTAYRQQRQENNGRHY